jgi:hypothetical protein
MAARAFTTPKKSKERPLSEPESELVIEERIRMRAHEIFLQRNGEHGSDVDDWLQAEREVRGGEQRDIERSEGEGMIIHDQQASARGTSTK